jgi:(p)ppGpp synthase/HD superfamily hydrolase
MSHRYALELRVCLMLSPVLAPAVTTHQDDRALFTATIEVCHVEQLSRVLDRIGRLPNVQEVRRQKG